MKRNGWKFCAKVCADGRLYAGCWAVDEVIPKKDTDQYYIADEVPDDIHDGHNYVWNGETLVYQPPVEETPAEQEAAE